MEQNQLVDRLLSVKPSPRQTAWQEMEYYNFIHFGLNTFYGKEWGDGTLAPSRFNPKKLDTDQWVQALKASGSKGVILTVKHHDGFCLYPSKYTDYSIKNTPYQSGKGDIVKALSQSCKKYGIKLGIYLSPWDRHEQTYGSPAYNDYFANQLTELMTEYGDVFCVWFDGACGESNPNKRQVYDFARFYSIIREYQPQAVIAVCGPDVRWIGNEGGHIRESEWSVVSRRLCDYEHVTKLSQSSDDLEFMNKPMLGTVTDLGSRDLLEKEKELCWYPAEMDVSITKRCWFWHKGIELLYTRSPQELLHLYYSAVGHNASFLLNVPVNRAGLIPSKFVKRLRQFNDIRELAFSKKLDIKKKERQQETYTLHFDKAYHITKIVLGEDLQQSQRVERFTLSARIAGRMQRIKEGTTIGYKEICLTDITADQLLLTVEQCRGESCINRIDVYG